MGRTVKDPNRRLPKPVQKVWLSEKKCRTAHPACSTASGDWIRFSGVWFYELSARRFRLA